MKHLMLAAMMLSATASAQAQTVLDDSFPADADVTLEQLHTAVSAKFVDPRSAQYKALVLRPNGNRPVICGLVNARNSLGGYTPFYPFAYPILSGDVVLGDTYDDELLGDMTVMTLEIVGCPLWTVGLD